ncbi:hypothetical protein [Microbacterium allomyrinae]|uniref:Uncharacterized protein n=1 Tax=Microbacterium allomyrinae TaxID=2830666 RepID=A0A9X1LUD4_9MICO|nr:hypothetical protein [Microbacterium allomyrinae]MCC2031838.1 hypothetical protein [Microbacterium allomyrinae]
MSPLDVIEIPGYPGWYARRCAVEAWQRAGSPPLVSAGRLYGVQKDLYDRWRAGEPGYNPADNPDDETQRLAHVRFVAFDLKNPARDRAAMIREGFVFPYGYEPWHGELPNVRSYAIVRSIPTTASTSVEALTTTTEEDPMFTIYRRGGSIRVVGNDRDFRIGGALTVLTGVDGTETLDVLAKGAKVVDLDDRQWDVTMVTLDATAGKPVASLDDTVIGKLVDAIIAKLPAAAGAATPADVRAAVADAFGGLVLKAERPAS